MLDKCPKVHRVGAEEQGSVVTRSTVCGNDRKMGNPGTNRRGDPVFLGLRCPCGMAVLAIKGESLTFLKRGSRRELCNGEACCLPRG